MSAETVPCRRIWIAKDGLIFQDTKTKEHRIVNPGQEVTNIDDEDLKGYLAKGLVVQNLVEA